MTVSVSASDVKQASTGRLGFFMAWLWGSAALVFAMAVIGAITRLTESGLSIMEWNVFAGTFPPLSQGEWVRLFEVYKQTGEYQKQHLSALTMDGFKQIFWWEYIHRLWGRLIGLAFLTGLIVFVVGRMRGRWSEQAWLMPHALFGFVLICFQGFLGWYMVSSGFDTELVDVSAYRLAAHLGLAVVIFLYFIGLGVRARTTGGLAFQARHIWNLPTALLVLVFVTLLSGAFVAGLNAGLIYNEFPTMGGAVIPADYQNGLPWFRNPFENPTAAQLHHRLFASLSALVVLVAAVAIMRGSASRRVKSWAGISLVIILGQYALGVVTLLYAVPISLGAAHQAGALSLLAALTVLRAHNNQENSI